MATIGSNATAQKFLTPEQRRAKAIRSSFDNSVAKLRESVRRTETAGGTKLTPWTDEELSAAITRLHLYYFGGDERPAIPPAHEQRVEFGFALSTRLDKLTDLPGHKAEWFPQADRDAQSFLSRPKSAKRSGATRTTETGNKLAAVS